MILLVSKATVKPEKVEEFKATAKPLIEGTRKENGNIAYELYAATTNPSVYTFIEKYKDEAAIEAHTSSRYFTETIPKLAELLAFPIEVDQYTLAI